MPTGAITSYIDVAQLVLYAFWLFFAGLIFYLRREDRREGYPLEPDLSERFRGRRGGLDLIPFIPNAKTFHLAHGDATAIAPDDRRTDRREHKFERSAVWPGAPFLPTGDPMLAGVGPGSWAEREDAPERTIGGEPNIVPLRVASDHYVAPGDPDPRGMEVIAADNRVAGVVSDLWVDRAEPQIRYLEVELSAAPAAAPSRTEAEGDAGPAAAAPTAAAARVLLPIHFGRIQAGRRQVRVRSILARHFADVPQTASSDQVTKREEDRITAYYAGGQRYADPTRTEPLL